MLFVKLHYYYFYYFVYTCSLGFCFSLISPFLHTHLSVHLLSCSFILFKLLSSFIFSLAVNVFFLSHVWYNDGHTVWYCDIHMYGTMMDIQCDTAIFLGLSSYMYAMFIFILWRCSSILCPINFFCTFSLLWFLSLCFYLIFNVRQTFCT